MTRDGPFVLGPRGWERIAMPAYNWPSHMGHPQSRYYQQQSFPCPSYPAPNHSLPYDCQSSARNAASLPTLNAPISHRTIPNSLTNLQSNAARDIFAAISAPYQQTQSAEHVDFPPPYALHNPQAIALTRQQKLPHPDTQAISTARKSWPQSLPGQTLPQPPPSHTTPVSTASVPYQSQAAVTTTNFHRQSAADVLQFQQEPRPQPTVIHSSPLLPASALTPQDMATAHWPVFPRGTTNSKRPLKQSSSTSSMPIYGHRCSPPRNKAIAKIPLAKEPQASMECHPSKQLSEKAMALKAPSDDRLSPPLIPRFPPNVEDLDRLVLGIEKQATRDEYVVVLQYFYVVPNKSQHSSGLLAA